MKSETNSAGKRYRRASRKWVWIVLLGILGMTPGMAWAGVNVWTSLGPEGGWVGHLVIDPQNPRTIYGGAFGSGVFKSTDGGANWNAVNSGLTTLNVQTLAIDPRNPSTVYAGTYGGGVFAITFVPELSAQIRLDGDLRRSK